MLKQPSPYTPGEIARTIPGRVQQLTDFDERLSYLVDLQRLAARPRSTLISARKPIAYRATLSRVP